MNQENDTHQQSIDVIAELARTEALKHGCHVPTLIVTGTEKGIVGELNLPDTYEEKAQVFFNAGFNLAQAGNIGIPLQVFFITEGWLSFTENGEIKTRPSEDPQRLEVLLIAGLYLLHAKHSLVVLEMVRDETDQLIELREHSRLVEEGRVESPLLNAFVMGYYNGLNTGENSPQLPS